MFTDSNTPIKILVVDDDADVCRMVASFLGKNGYEVHTAMDALQAQDVLENQPIQLLITDLMMPHLDGVQLTQQIRTNPKYKNLPVILITAHPAEETMETALRKGVAMTLSKPIDLSRLLTLVGFATH